MAAFDSAFDSAFDAGAAPAQPIDSGVLSFVGEISVVDPLVFVSSAGYLRWSARVQIDNIDVSSRLTGALKISAQEDAGRVASFSVVAASALELTAYDSAAVTIDLTLFRDGQTATYRRFTGRIEAVRFSVTQQLAEIDCLDGWRERPKSCTSAAQVESLFGGLATPCPKIVKWDDSEPDPLAYFSALLPTLRGATFIDSSGVWRTIPWAIGTAKAAFGAGDILDDTLQLKRPNRVDIPSAITATLNHRFPRLHAVEKNLEWSTFPRVRHLADGLPVAPKSMIQSAVERVPGWLVKGNVILDSPIPGSYPVIIGGQTLYYLISYNEAPLICDHMTATLYRRWYQQVEVHYRVTIAMGGLSDRDDSVSASLESKFDTGVWETIPSTEVSTGIYYFNAPTPLPGSVAPTGYEGLPDPRPPANSAIDHYADITLLDLQSGVDFVVAQALRRAVAGRRKQTVSFERPIDPRWEIGDVLSVASLSLSASGQVVEFDDILDHDSGDAITRIVLSCPDGNSGVTWFSAAITPPVPTVAHALLMPALGNHVGAAQETPARPDEDQLLGFLCNVIPTGNTYDAAKPVYEPQFRIIMPAIPADVRDPVDIDADITATINIAGSGIGVSF